MQKFTFALIGLLVLIAIAIGIRVMLPDADNPDTTIVKAVSVLDIDSEMQQEDQADSARTGTNITNEKKMSVGPVSEQETAEENHLSISTSGTPAPSFSAGSSFSDNETNRPTDAQIKRYIELRKETLALQKGPEALEHYYELKQQREQKTLAREEYRKLRREYNEKHREWKLMLEQAEENARITGDNYEVDELRKLEPERPKRNLGQPAEKEQE